MKSYEKQSRGFCKILWHAACYERIDQNDFFQIPNINCERRNQQMPVVKRLGLILTTLWLTAQTALAAGGGGEPIVIVADSRKLTGVMAWWANLYNESHLYFTLLTVVLIPVIGVLFGVLADFIMHFVGIDLKSRDLAEH
jgi:hypothetical protein